jgi:CheY-like chemotaxis protein
VTVVLSGGSAARSARLPRVLVIDDEPDMRDMLAEALPPRGFDVTVAESGAVGLAAIGRSAFDVVVTDLKMPEMDGLDTLAAIKRLRPELEVVVVTGYGSVDTAIQAVRNGAFDYVRKPYDLSTLTAALRNAVAERDRRSAFRDAAQALASAREAADVAAVVEETARRIFGAEASLVSDGPPAPDAGTVAGAAAAGLPRRDVCDDGRHVVAYPVGGGAALTLVRSSAFSTAELREGERLAELCLVAWSILGRRDAVDVV